MRWAGHVTCIEKRRGPYRVLVGRPEGKRPLERSKHRWEDYNEIDVKDVRWGSIDWAVLARGRDM
jgi:hypothetical protein